MNANFRYLEGQQVATKHMRFRTYFDEKLNRTIRVPYRFGFTTGFWGGKDWQQRGLLMEQIEAVVRNYSDLEPAGYSDIVHLGDVLIYTKYALKQTLGVVLLATFLISLLFLPIKCGV